MWSPVLAASEGSPVRGESPRCPRQSQAPREHPEHRGPVWRAIGERPDGAPHRHGPDPVCQPVLGADEALGGQQRHLRVVGNPSATAVVRRQYCELFEAQNLISQRRAWLWPVCSVRGRLPSNNNAGRAGHSRRCDDAHPRNDRRPIEQGRESLRALKRIHRWGRRLARLAAHEEAGPVQDSLSVNRS